MSFKLLLHFSCLRSKKNCFYGVVSPILPQIIGLILNPTHCVLEGRKSLMYYGDLKKTQWDYIYLFLLVYTVVPLESLVHSEEGGRGLLSSQWMKY